MRRCAILANNPNFLLNSSPQSPSSTFFRKFGIRPSFPIEIHSEQFAMADDGLRERAFNPVGVHSSCPFAAGRLSARYVRRDDSARDHLFLSSDNMRELSAFAPRAGQSFSELRQCFFAQTFPKTLTPRTATGKHVKESDTKNNVLGIFAGQ